MANVYYWLKRIRKTREEERLLQERFEKYEPSYLEALESLEDLGGEALVDELAEWLLKTARKEQRLPRPSRVRERAREICAENGVDVPSGSPLHD